MMYMATYGFKDDITNPQAIDDIQERINNQVTNTSRKYFLAVSAVAGESRPDYTMTDVLEDTDYYTQINDIEPSDAQRAEEAISKILSIITNIGIIISVIIPAIVGVKYMIGSVEERAEYKKDMIPYFVGAVLIFGISIIIKIVQAFGNQIKTI